MMDTIPDEGKSIIRPEQLSAKLMALALARELIAYHPTTSVISDQFCLGNGIMVGVDTGFFRVYMDDKAEKSGDTSRAINEGLGDVIRAFEQFEIHSPSIGGRRAEQLVECIINAARTGYQNMNPLYEERQPGALERLLNFVRGNKSPSQ